MKKKKKLNKKSWLIHKLRRISIMWPPRTEAITNARVERGVYACASCRGHFKRNELHIDHIHPVIDISGFTTWDSFIDSLFCDSNNLQALCPECHGKKSETENKKRVKLRKKVKK